MSGTSYLIFIQVVSRALTFAGNQILLRYVSPESFGIAAQLELYSVSVLYFSRESLRVALQRQPLQNPPTIAKDKGQTSMQEQAQAAINASYVPVVLGLVLSLCFGMSFWKFGAENVVRSPRFSACLQLYGLATIAEILGEPGFNIIQQSLDFRSRAVTETAGSVAKCLVAWLVALIAQRNAQQVAILPFAAGQLVYACTLFLGYTVSGIRKAKSLKTSLVMRPVDSQGDYYFYGTLSHELLSLSTSMYMQSVVKQVLSQGDALILATFSSLEEQGAFALTSNYGGLAARLIFQPIEESSRSSFGQLLRHSSANDHTRNNARPAMKMLHDILKTYGIISIFASCFAPYAFPILVHVIAGDRWFSPAMQRLLATYCYYVPFMAVNGITEAFVSSVASSKELKTQSIWMSIFSAAFGLAAFLFLRILSMGAPGLVWANIVSMFLRITWSFWFIQSCLKHNNSTLQFQTLLPSPWSVLSGLLVSAYLHSRTSTIQRLQDLLAPTFVCISGVTAM